MTGSFAFGGPARGVLLAAGIWWAALGALFLIDASVRFLIARLRGTFARGGVFSACRSPFSAWAAFFAFPAAALIFDDTLFFGCAAIVLLTALSRSAAQDEGRKSKHGHLYQEYMLRTRPLLPLPRKTGLKAIRTSRLILFAAGIALYSIAVLAAVILPLRWP